MLDILPAIADGGYDLVTSPMTLAELYDVFIDRRFENERIRLSKSRDRLSIAEQEALDAMDGDFVHEGVSFLMRLSDSIFGKLGGVNSVDYSTMDSEEWKTDFFGTREKAKMLRKSSLLSCRKTFQKSSLLALKRGLSVRGKSTYSFSHGSILEFFYAYLVYDPRNEPPFNALSACLDSTDDLSPLSSHPLGQQDLVS